uniref:glycosyltransferase family 4 protein n=1 Tax=uncultured Sphingomonas sp. TaxID=158754 RepID=UPI0035C9E517
MVHVRHIVRQFHPAVGGLEDAVANLAAELARQGIDGSVVTLDRAFGDPATVMPSSDSYRDIPITRIPYRGSSRYPIAPGVLQQLDGADIVHVHGIDFFFDFLALTRLVHHKPLVASTHGGFFHTSFASRAKRVFFQTATRASARGYDRIFGSSESDAAMFRQIAPRTTIAIENGVNIEKWRDAASHEAVPTLLFIGRFSVNKNVAALIALVAALDPAWRLIIAGQPSDLTGDDLRDEAARLGVADRVEVVTGADDATLRTLVGRASYVASASRYEGFGLSVVEGMSAGLTPILSGIAPFERLVAGSGCGVIVDMDDPAGAAHAVQALHAARSPGARAANMAAVQVYSWTGVAAKFAAEYRAVLAARAAA